MAGLASRRAGEAPSEEAAARGRREAACTPDACSMLPKCAATPLAFCTLDPAAGLARALGQMMRARRGGGGEGVVRHAVLIWILAIALFSAGLSLLTQHHATYELHEPVPIHADAHARHHRHRWDDHRSLHAERRHHRHRQGGFLYATGDGRWGGRGGWAAGASREARDSTHRGVVEPPLKEAVWVPSGA